MKISVILPVLNESPGVGESLARLRASAPRERMEIVVVDGGSVDGTTELAALWADKVIATPPGRGQQMHAGALAATGDLFLFLHADTRLPDDWPEILHAAWGGPDRPACTAFQLSFDRPDRVYRWIERAARWRFQLTSVPHGDQALALLRATYFSVGGFPPVPLMEEYYLARKLKRMGAICLLPAAAVTSARRYEKNGPVRNALRNSLLVMLFHLEVAPAVLKRMYR
jgi:rSAM/selenodomain-associated transferase 2